MLRNEIRVDQMQLEDHARSNSAYVGKHHNSVSSVTTLAHATSDPPILFGDPGF
jgi:hypothetical protein